MGVRANAVLPVAATGGTGNMPAADIARFAEAMGALAGRIDIEQVVPLVVYLASSACEPTGAAYSAIGGNFARVYQGITPGWWAPTSAPSAEEVAAHLGEIDADDAHAAPDTMLDAFAWVAARAPRTVGSS